MGIFTRKNTVKMVISIALKERKKMNIQKLPVIIVTYFPSKTLIENIEKLQKLETISSIYVVDNTAEYNKYIEQLYEYSKVILIKNKTNVGIGKAQNIAMKALFRKSENWAITFDQDSIIFTDIFDKYLDYINKNDCTKIGIISSDYYDKGSQTNAFNNSSVIYVNEVISSGSLLNLKVVDQLGYFKENFFMDIIDNEYCYRLRKFGYEILVTPGVGFQHTMGNITKKNVLGLKFYLYNQNYRRLYYRTRNKLWLIHLYKDKSLARKYKKSILIDFIKIFFEDDKKMKFKSFFCGIRDGVIYYEE